MKPIRKPTQTKLEYSFVNTYSEELKVDGMFFMIKNLTGYVNIQMISYN